MQDILVKKIKGGLMGMRNGTKTKEEIIGLINMMKKINKGVHEELLNDYIATVKQIENGK